MPLYDYLCEQCGRHTEKIQKFSDPILTVCPLCGGKVERVMHAPNVAFKGGGWFADGYGNAKPAAANNEGGAGKSDSGTPAAPSSATAASSGSESASKPATAPSAPAPAAPAPASSSSDKK
jgi:putative FmdB family regulatory protein